jgi:hypothetical protein
MYSFASFPVLTFFPLGHRERSKRAPTSGRNYPAALRQQELNGAWSLPKARPISCNDSPAFLRRHMSVLCSPESLSRFPCVINTTFRKMIHIRWCCIDRLRPPFFSASSSFQAAGSGRSWWGVLYPSQQLRGELGKESPPDSHRSMRGSGRIENQNIKKNYRAGA